MEAGLFKPKDTPKTAKDGQPVGNMFDVLNVYTPSEAFLNAPDITPEPTVQYTVEQETTWEDAAFAFIALLRDLENLAQEINSLWTRWGTGELDLAAAAVAPNAAFELAQNMENEVADVLGPFGGSAMLVNGLFQSVCETLGINWKQKRAGESLTSRAMNFQRLSTSTP
jgi:hypothetical protein